jgi:hypothetical protein
MKSLAVTAGLFLCSVSLFGSADLVTTVVGPNQPLRAGYASSVSFQVRNNGPDLASAVKVSIAADVPTTCSCDLGDIPQGQLRGVLVTFQAPTVDAQLTFSATVSSNTPDPNPANNSASVVLTVSADPDLGIFLLAPPIQDLSLPFTVTVALSNLSKTTAHDIEATIDFRTDVAVQSLPAGCINVTQGRIVCRVDSLPTTTIDAPGPRFSFQLLAPSFYGSGSVIFKAVVTEREHDFDPISNIATQQMALYKTFYVSNTNSDGGGSLRFAILNANGQCLASERCAIAFRIDEASPKPWKSITITSPLPAVTAPQIRIDGATQSAFFGNKNPDGPDIEITGVGSPDGDGLVVASCGAEVANLAINGFGRNGMSVVPSAVTQCPFGGGTNLHHLFVGTDAAGSIARPNSRGIGTSFENGASSGPAGVGVGIRDCVISGNLHSGIFGLSGRLIVQRNRIGVMAHSDDPLPNGNAGVFIGAGGYGSDVGPSVSFSSSANPDQDGNVIAFNGQMGVGVATGVADVAIRRNRIWGNTLLGIDIGLDGPSQSTGGVTMPAITLAHYDPVMRQTVIEGEVSPTSPPSTFNAEVGLFANDAPDPTGLGEGQRPIGTVAVPPNQHHFRFAVDGDLTGQFISATMTRIQYNGFAKPDPEGVADLFFTQTSEFSPVIEVR